MAEKHKQNFKPRQPIDTQFPRWHSIRRVAISDRPGRKQPRSDDGSPNPATMMVAHAGGSEIAIIQPAETVLGTHRGIGRAQAREPRENHLDIGRERIEMQAIAATVDIPDGHRPSRSQKEKKTWVDKKKPRMTLTSTPIVKA